MLNIEEIANGCNFFCIETRDEEVFNRIRKKINVKKGDFDIIPAGGDVPEDYYYIDIQGKERLEIALEGEKGEYFLYGRKRERDKRSRLLLENAVGTYKPGEMSFSC